MKKDKIVAIVIALFLGGLGIHWLYLGRINRFIIYFLFSFTFIPLVLSFFDIIFIRFDGKFDEKYNT